MCTGGQSSSGISSSSVFSIHVEFSINNKGLCAASKDAVLTGHWPTSATPRWDLSWYAIWPRYHPLQLMQTSSGHCFKLDEFHFNCEAPEDMQYVSTDCKWSLLMCLTSEGLSPLTLGVISPHRLGIICKKAPVCAQVV